MSRNPELPSGKEERIAYLKKQYEKLDPNLSESNAIAKLHEETGVSERTLYTYKKKYEWERAKVDPPNARKEIRNVAKPLRGVTELELAAKTFLGRSRADLDWQAHYPEKGIEIDDGEKLNWIKRIGKEYFLTGDSVLLICERRMVDFADFVEWTTENQNCRDVWQAFQNQRTNFTIDFMQAACFEMVRELLTGKVPPIESETFLWVKDSTYTEGGFYERKTKTVTTGQRANPAQVVTIMKEVSDWAEKQRRNKTNNITDAKAMKTLAEIQERIEFLTNQLADDESGEAGGPTE